MIYDQAPKTAADFEEGDTVIETEEIWHAGDDREERTERWEIEHIYTRPTGEIVTTQVRTRTVVYSPDDTAPVEYEIFEGSCGHCDYCR